MSKEKLLINDGKSNNSEFISNKELDGLARLICKYYADDPNCCRCPDCWARDEAKDLCEAGYQRQEWISVEDALPTKQCEVLVCYGFDRGDGDLGMMFVGVLTYFAYDKNPHFQHEETGLRVTHWMPLPQPPKGE